MKTTKQSCDEWWAGEARDLRIFLRDVLGLVRSIGPNEVLTLRFNGRNFSPWLTSDHRSAAEVGACAAKACELGPEDWWHGLSGGWRAFARELAKIVRELKRDCDKSLEIRNTGHCFKAKLILNLKRATQPGVRGGRAAGN